MDSNVRDDAWILGCSSVTDRFCFVLGLASEYNAVNRSHERGVGICCWTKSLNISQGHGRGEHQYGVRYRMPKDFESPIGQHHDAGVYGMCRDLGEVS